MTTEALDLLERLSSPELAAKAEKDANRPFDRFAGKHFRADIPAQELEIISRRPTGSNFDQWGLYLVVNITEVYDGNVEPGEHQIWIRSATPTTRDGKENKRTNNSELVRMTEASGRSPRAWVGNKGVEFTEDTFEYTYDRNTNQRGSDGKDIWERGVVGTTYFYRLNFSGAAKANGAAPVSAQPSAAAIQRALDTIKAAGEDGVVEREFNLAMTKGNADPADNKAMMKYVTEGDGMTKHQEVLRDGEKLIWIAE